MALQETYNDLLKACDSLEPLVPYEEPTASTPTDSVIALATMYANKDYRTFLSNAINIQIRSTALYATGDTEVMLGRGRITALKELLSLSKKCFDNLEKLRKNNATTKGEV